MPTLQKNYFFTVDLGTGIHNLTTATLKLAITNTAPTTATHVYADIVSPLATTNLVGANPLTLTSTTWTQSTGTSTLASANLTLTSQTGDFGPFQYIVVYNDSATNKNVIGWYNYGSALTLHGTSGDQFVIDLTANILTNA